MADEIPDGLSADLVKVGERLRRLRKERGWRLEDLAERMNLCSSPSRISKAG